MENKKPKTKQVKKIQKPKSKAKKQHNYFLWVVVAILSVPILVFSTFILQAMENTGEPIVGNRFDDELDPPITDELMQRLKNEVKLEGIEITFNLKSATLRVMVNGPDDTDKNAIKYECEAVYKQIVKILPEETYFTNKENTKMYDLEVHAYNVLEPSENRKVIHYVKSKSGAGEVAVLTDMSTAKNPEVAQELMKKEKQG